MPTGTVSAIAPERREGRVLLLGQEIPTREQEIRPGIHAGARVRFDLTWDEGVLEATNVRPIVPAPEPQRRES